MVSIISLLEHFSFRLRRPNIITRHHYILTISLTLFLGSLYWSNIDQYWDNLIKIKQISVKPISVKYCQMSNIDWKIYVNYSLTITCSNNSLLSLKYVKTTMRNGWFIECTYPIKVSRTIKQFWVLFQKIGNNNKKTRFHSYGSYIDCSIFLFDFRFLNIKLNWMRIIWIWRWKCIWVSNWFIFYK